MLVKLTSKLAMWFAHVLLARETVLKRCFLLPNGKNGIAQPKKKNTPFAPQAKKSVFDELNLLDFSLPENNEMLLRIVQNKLGAEQTDIVFAVQPQSQISVFLPQSNSAFQASAKKLKNDISGEKLVDWLLDFWNPDKSKYIREKRARGFAIGARHCYEMTNRVKKYWRSDLGDVLVGEIDGEVLSDFFLELKEVRNLSGGSINKIMNAGTVAFKWAFEHKQLTENLAEGVMRFAVTNRERGILTENEAIHLFKNEWKNSRAKVANLLAMTTGMRAGEILALRPCDIMDTHVQLVHSWSEKDGLKCPKNGKARKVPLVTGMRDMLLKLAASNPHGISPSNFIFYSTLPTQPIVINVLIDNLAFELRNIGIDEEQRQERNIVFHSWRHSAKTGGFCAWGIIWLVLFVGII